MEQVFGEVSLYARILVRINPVRLGQTWFQICSLWFKLGRSPYRDRAATVLYSIQRLRRRHTFQL